MFTLAQRTSSEVTLKKRITLLERRLKATTECLEQISTGNFDITVPEPAISNDEEKSFINTFTRVKSKLAEYAQEEKERTWVAEGIEKCMSLLSGDNRLRQDFYDRILAFLIKYTGANQGGLFILNNEEEDPCLELIACYAYDKRKCAEKRIGIGQGMLGQCFLEKKTTVVTSLPQFYVSITSGLGEATPDFLLMVPIQYNEQTLGVLELASFGKLAPYKIEFIEKICENIASVILNLHHSERAEQLFAESQEKAKMLEEQEAKLHQNIEELQSTQEEMRRNQLALDAHANFLKFVLDNIPYPVFVKDEKGRYSHVNRAESQIFNLSDEDLIGKDDSYFVKDAEEWKTIKESDERVLASNLPVELPLQNITTSTGAAYIFRTTKIPFINNITGRKNILGVSIDLTEKLDLQKQLIKEKNLNQHNTLMNVAGRQRMLSQKIGFCAEMLVQGKKKHAESLREAIELYDHSLQVLCNGGMPMGITCEKPLPGLAKELRPCLDKGSEMWSVYKKAAENILYFSSLRNNDRDESEKNITIIEEHGEALLVMNDNFVKAFMNFYETNLTEAV